MSDKQSVPSTEEIKDNVHTLTANEIKNPKKTQALRLLKARYGENVTLEKLAAVAKVMMQSMGHNMQKETPSLTRDDIRNKDQLIIWFNTNIEFIWPFLSPGMMIGYDSCKFCSYTDTKRR